MRCSAGCGVSQTITGSRPTVRRLSTARAIASRSSPIGASTIRQSTHVAQRSSSSIVASVSVETIDVVAGDRVDRSHRRRRPLDSTTSMRLVGRLIAFSKSLQAVVEHVLDVNRLGDEAARPSVERALARSSVETTQTGMCRVDRSFFRRSMTRQPSMSGRRCRA